MTYHRGHRGHRPGKRAFLRGVVLTAMLAVISAAQGQRPAHQVHAIAQTQGVPAMPRFRFENFTTANGLPDNHVYSVLVDGDRVWAGTDNGLGGLRERELEDLHDGGWTGASRGAVIGAGQADRAMCGRERWAG